MYGVLKKLPKKRRVALRRFYGQWQDVLGFRILGEENPYILGDFGDEGINDRQAQWLGIDGGEVVFGKHLPGFFRRRARIDQIINQQPAFTIDGDGALRHLKDFNGSLERLTVG